MVYKIFTSRSPRSLRLVHFNLSLDFVLLFHVSLKYFHALVGEKKKIVHFSGVIQHNCQLHRDTTLNDMKTTNTDEFKIN